MKKRKGSSRKERTTALAVYLTSARVNNGLTQEEIAKRLKKTKSFICRIERSQRERQCLRGYILYQLAKAYDVPINEVLRKANWPQLLLLDIDKEGSKDIIRYIKNNL